MNVETIGTFRLTRHRNYGNDGPTGLPRVKLSCSLCTFAETYVPDDRARLDAEMTKHTQSSHPTGGLW